MVKRAKQIAVESKIGNRTPGELAKEYVSIQVLAA
jgi:hypothetical protein